MIRSLGTDLLALSSQQSDNNPLPPSTRPTRSKPKPPPPKKPSPTKPAVKKGAVKNGIGKKVVAKRSRGRPRARDDDDESDTSAVETELGDDDAAYEYTGNLSIEIRQVRLRSEI